VLLPLVRRAEVEQLLPVCFPDLAGESAEWRQVSRLAIRRATLKVAVLSLLGVVAWWFRAPGWWALAPLLAIPLSYAINLQSYRHLGYALSERYLRLRRGWLGRTTHIVPVAKVQAVELRQTPFDRRLGLASLYVDTAGQAYTGGGPRLGNLPLAEAQALAQTLAQRAAATVYKG
jgi:putative membrane protein